MDMTRRKYRRPANILKYRRLWRFSLKPIVLGLHHQLYLNNFVNSSMSWDYLQVTLMELDRTSMSIFMRFYSKMAVMKNGAKRNMIIIIPMHVYLAAMLNLGL